MKRIEAEIDDAAAARRMKLRGQPVRIECVHLPYWMFPVRIADRRHAKPMLLLIGGFENEQRLIESGSIRWTECEDATAFTPTISQRQAIEQFRRRSDADVSPELVEYPFWVAYVRRMGDRIEPRMLDAVSGKPAGPKVVNAFLTALSHAEQREAVTTP